MFHVPGYFLREMTRIGQGVLVDRSSHFLENYNYNYQTRKLNVFVAITDVVSQFVFFLWKFQVLLLWIYRLLLLRTGASEWGSTTVIGLFSHLLLLHECSQDAANEVEDEEEHRRSLGEREKRCRAIYYREWWPVCCDKNPTMISEESAATFALLSTLVSCYFVYFKLPFLTLN